jgi:hypothetical protein
MRLATLAGKVFVGHPAFIPAVRRPFVTGNLNMSPLPAFPADDDLVENNRVRGLKGTNPDPFQVRSLTKIQAITLDEATGLLILYRNKSVGRCCDQRGNDRDRRRSEYEFHDLNLSFSSVPKALPQRAVRAAISISSLGRSRPQPYRLLRDHLWCCYGKCDHVERGGHGIRRKNKQQ